MSRSSSDTPTAPTGAEGTTPPDASVAPDGIDPDGVDRDTPTDPTGEIPPPSESERGGTIPSPPMDSEEELALRWGGGVQLVDQPTGIAVLGSVSGGFDGEVVAEREGMTQGVAISAARAVLEKWQGSLLDVDGDELEKQVCDEARPQLVALGFSGELVFDGLELAPASQQALQAALATDAPLQPGAVVSVRWSDGVVYQATLVQVGEGQMLVTFPNGQQHWVSMEAVTPMAPPVRPSGRGQ
jgi:hypothetical protein